MIIVIAQIDMKRERERQKIIDYMTECIKKDVKKQIYNNTLDKKNEKNILRNLLYCP